MLKTAEENFRTDNGSKGKVPVMAAKSSTDAKSRYYKYRDFRGAGGTPSSDGVPTCDPADVRASLPLVGLPEDPISAGNLPAVLGIPA